MITASQISIAIGRKKTRHWNSYKNTCVIERVFKPYLFAVTQKPSFAVIYPALTHLLSKALITRNYRWLNTVPSGITHRINSPYWLYQKTDTAIHQSRRRCYISIFLHHRLLKREQTIRRGRHSHWQQSTQFLAAMRIWRQGYFCR